MKKIQIRAAVLALCALFLGGCSNLFNSQSSSRSEMSSPDIPEGFGTVEVSLSRGAARTVMPSFELSSLSLKYLFAKDEGEPQEKIPEGGKFILEPGSYTLEVRAFLSEDLDALVAAGQTDGAFSILAGTDAEPVNITLRPAASGEGEGSLEFGLSYPAGVTVESFTLTRIAGEDSFNLMDPLPETSGGDPVTLNGTRDAIPVGYYLLRVALRNSDGTATGKTEVVHIYQNLRAQTSLAAYTFTADDFMAYLVTTSADTGVGSLRRALVDAPDGATIRVMLDPGSVITLETPLPAITQSLTLEGNGVTLTPGSSWTSSEASQLLNIGNPSVEATIRRVHFKNGRTTQYGGAIHNKGTLTLESCIFSGNQCTSAGGGAVYTAKILTIRGCTFYNNYALTLGGAIYTGLSDTKITLTGNLFYGNTTRSGKSSFSANPTSLSCNVTDSAETAWANGTGNITSISDPPMGAGSFKPLSGKAAVGKLPSTLPQDYPATDFYGNPIDPSGPVGAAQEIKTAYYYLDLSAINNLAGSVAVEPEPDEDGFHHSGESVSISANATGTGYVFGHWLVNGSKAGTANPLSISPSDQIRIQAVFALPVTSFDDSTGADTTPGTLRYALTNAKAGDAIIFSGVTPGVTAIELTSALPEIKKSLIIEGNGVILTRASSWTASSETSQLLYISAAAADVQISAVHFKNGLSSGYGGAIRNAGILTLESCIFSGNRNTATSATSATYGGGAVYSSGALTIRGCTFYDNACSSGAYGGAIYFNGSGKTLTLTGNVFYANTAPSYPVVCVNYGTVNASYNVVDKAFGTETTNCGWTKGTEDHYSVVLPLWPADFKLSKGSAVAAKLPDPLTEKYPARDFYGQTISASGAAGAVQASSENNGEGYSYLGLSVNDSQRGTISSIPPPANGIIQNGSVTIKANPNETSFLHHWLVNGVETTETEPNTLIISVTTPTSVQAVYGLLVTSAVDSIEAAAVPGTLRHALANVAARDTIFVSGVTAAIELTNALPEITKSLTIEGNGVTLTRSSSWTSSDTSQLLYISAAAADVQISAVHFKNGLSSGYGGAIRNAGILTLDSCIFSGNRNTATSATYGGGAVYSNKTLTIRSCTFYDNACSSGAYGGAIYFTGSSYALALTGNLFYGNTASSYPVVRVNSGSSNASHNIVDKASGTGTAACGWSGGTGNVYLVSALPLSPKTFKLLYGSAAAAKLPDPLTEKYPTKDFYGQDISGSGAVGAVQAMTASGYSYLDLLVNDSQRGGLSSSPTPDADGLVPSSSVIITASPALSCVLSHWLVDGVKTPGTALNELTISSLPSAVSVQAVFSRVVTVSSFNDTGVGTLRDALNNLQEHDIIRLTGVTPGATAIELTSRLPEITKSLSIEGNGVTLTRAVSWTASSLNSQFLYISGSSVEAKISAVHFKNGLSSGYGGAIRNDGLLTLESCIFSGNRNTAASATYGGGAVHSSKNLTIRGSAFYDNACSFSGIYGGAILLASTSSILTLTGNVFYGNTATSYPVVRVNSGSSVNASYNMVDKASGTGTAACGWSGGTGNVYSVNALPLSPKTFKLLYGSAAADVLPSPLPSVYPARDFYGQDISAFGSAGAVQAVTYNMSGYSYLDLSVNDSQRGSLSSSPTPDADGLVSNNTVTITATPAVASGNVSFVLSHWLVNGVKTPAAANQLTISVSAHTWVQAVFYRVVAVSGFNDSGAGTLREALTDLQEHDIIRLTGVTQGTTAIELTSALPAITKSLTIEGNGVTLTRASSWTDSSETSQLLYISGSSVEARIGAVHFKNGLSSGYGGAIRNAGILTLDSCIFSGNRNTATVTSYGGGAVYSDKTLTIRGCTFYDNACSSGAEGGAIYFTGSSYILTLTGNLFYGNTASYPVVRLSYGTVNASYNVVDKAAGTGTAACGWSGGTEDVYSVSVLPLLPKTFKVLYGSDATDALPSLLPSGYPAKDFYGQDISGSGATGAVQAITAPGYSYLDHLSVNDSLKGSVYVSSNPAPDADGLVPSSSITIAATPNASCVLSHWLVNEVKTPSTDLNELTISSLPSVVSVQAVFSRVVTVSSFNNAGTGTLREALTNLQEHDIIRLTGVTAGTTAIELTSALPAITKSLTIEGNGVTLTRASSWTVSAESQMLYISGGATVAKISAVHFKNGLSSGFGGAIRNAGILTLESCIFSGNRNTATSTIYSGGAVYSSGDLIIRGCTFYDNACSGSVYCGAIYAASSLTLTGNLFYRNTASSYPVVRVVGGKPINASYNVVDKASGTGATACGWAETAGTGNVYSLGVLPLSPVTFKLLYGSAAAGVVPSQSDYPAKDFYGQTISASGAAGAVQAMTASGYSYMDLSVNDSQRGSLSLNPAPDAEGLVPNGTVTITATPVISYIVSHWLVDDVETTGTVLNELTISVSAHTRIQAVFYRLVTVSNFADSGAGTLREALTNPQEHDIIRLTGVTAGTTSIELNSCLPTIAKNLTIEGNGITLTRASSWTPSTSSQMLYIYTSSSVVDVKISAVHFKDGLSSGYGGAIRNAELLTLESCIFSGNQNTATSTSYGGGAVHSSASLTIRGCTFYNNACSSSAGGAIIFTGSSSYTLTLTGNLFYENAAATYPVVRVSSTGIVNASYNVVDAPFGAGTTDCGWAAGTGDKTLSDLSIIGSPFVDTTAFVPITDTGLNSVITTKPQDFPDTDFYGTTRTFAGSPGAVK